MSLITGAVPLGRLSFFEVGIKSISCSRMALKRLISISLLVAFLFNIIGYYGVYVLLRTSADNGLRERLDANNFSESEAITFKVPLAIPYQANSEFQRVDGEFQKDGKFYNLVKQKIQNDTLFIVVVPDHDEASLFESLVSFVQSNTDNPISKKAGKLIENFSKDFLCCSSELATASVGWVAEPSFSISEFSLSRVFHKVHSPPPRS